VHSFCLELMPDFQPTSEVTHLSFSLWSGILFTTNHDFDHLLQNTVPALPARTIAYNVDVQSQLWDLNPQLWLSWWPDMLQWTQFSSVLLLSREKFYPWLHLQLPRGKELPKRSPWR
jgi:hypothetical protein